MFAGSDTSALAVTWTMYLLAQHPAIQDRLRAELLSISPPSINDLSTLTDDEVQSLYTVIAELPYLHNVTREAMRVIPPIHSSMREVTEDDEIPTLYPVHNRDGTVDEGRRTVSVRKGTFIHVAIEGFNLDRKIWGEDAWEFKYVL